MHNIKTSRFLELEELLRLFLVLNFTLLLTSLREWWNGDICTFLWIYTIRCMHVSNYTEVNLFFERSMYNFAPYILFLIGKQVFFLSVILVEILKNFVNNHTCENHFVPVYSMTACWGSSFIPAFIRNLRTAWRWLIGLPPPPFYSREKNSRFPINSKFDGYQRRSGGFGEMSGVMINASFR
jgi:hypothetical protein